MPFYYLGLHVCKLILYLLNVKIAEQRKYWDIIDLIETEIYTDGSYFDELLKIPFTPT